MIIKDGKTISSIYKGSQAIDKIYKGTLVVYEGFKKLLASGVPPLILGKSILPSEYQRVEYIESTGTQYIDTGIIPNQDTGFDIDFLTKNDLTATDAKFGSIMGARLASASREFQLTTYSTNSKGILRYGSNAYNAGLAKNIRMHIELKDKVYTNNDDLTYSVTGTFESPVSLTIFALNQNGTVTQYGKNQLFSLKLYDNKTLIRDYIPCYRRSDGAIGLYDLVEDKFYTNKGTGIFLKGKDIKGFKSSGKDLVDYKIFGNSKQGKLPSEYQQVESLTSTSTQYIDKGVIPNNNTGVDLVYKALEYSTSQYILGVRDTAINYAVNGSLSRNDWDIRFDGNPIYSLFARNSNKMRTQISMSNGNGTWTLTDLDENKTTQIPISNVTVTSTLTLHLFSYNAINPPYPYNHANLVVYSCKLYDGETLIRDFVPCYRKSDNVIGMYDLVEGKFYTNQGTGEFYKGSDTPTPNTPIEVESVGDKTSNLFDAYINNSQWLVKTEILDNNIIKQTGTSSTNSDGYSQFKVHLNIGTYTMSVSTSGNATGTAKKNIYIWKGPNAAVGTIETLSFTNKGETTFEITEENDYWLGVYGRVFLDEVQLFQIQIEQGTVATEYEPYGKYKIPVKARSKNLFDINT